MTEVDGINEPETRPDGRYVTWQGGTYRGGPTTKPPRSVVICATEPVDELFEPTRGGYRRVVPEAEATVFTLTTTCRWRGALFQVTGRGPDGRVDLLYLGHSQPEAEALGLRRADRDVYGISVPESELNDLVQTRTESQATPGA
jgi:hypothetical protein